VNSQTKAPTDAMALADWITNEQNQLKRFQSRHYGPSNIVAAANPDVQANLALAALALQGQFAVSQKDVTGSYWAPAGAFGATLVALDYSKSIKDMLDEMVKQITA
jgi:arabinogalactan oligomer/maltooligosaccharide transport system substrate-binding protein